MKNSVIKIEEINEIENRKNIKEINRKKSWLYEKMNKIENFLGKKKRIQIINIQILKGPITVNPTDIKMIVREHYKQLSTHKFDNLDKITNSLKTTNYSNSPKMK